MDYPICRNVYDRSVIWPGPLEPVSVHGVQESRVGHGEPACVTQDGIDPAPRTQGGGATLVDPGLDLTGRDHGSAVEAAALIAGLDMAAVLP